MISIKDEIIIFSLSKPQTTLFEHTHIPNALFVGGIGYFGNSYFVFKNFHETYYFVKRETI